MERLLVVEVPGRVENTERVLRALTFDGDGRGARLALPGCSGVELRGAVVEQAALVLDLDRGCVAATCSHALRFRSLADYVVPGVGGALGLCAMASDETPDVAHMLALCDGRIPLSDYVPPPPRIASTDFPHISVVSDAPSASQPSWTPAEMPEEPTLPPTVESSDEPMGSLDGASLGATRAFGEPVPPHPGASAAGVLAAHAETAQRLSALFQERPVWLRPTLCEVTGLSAVTLRLVLPALAYCMRDGPWRMCWVRADYDPAARESAAQASSLQVVELRSMRASARAGAASAALRAVLSSAQPSRIFDGSRLVPLTGLYQLCDLRLASVQELVANAGLRRTCTRSDGWLPSGTVDAVRSLVRRRWAELAAALDPAGMERASSPMAQLAEPVQPAAFVSSGTASLSEDAFEIYDGDDD